MRSPPRISAGALIWRVVGAACAAGGCGESVMSKELSVDGPERADLWAFAMYDARSSRPIFLDASALLPLDEAGGAEAELAGGPDEDLWVLAYARSGLEPALTSEDFTKQALRPRGEGEPLMPEPLQAFQSRGGQPLRVATDPTPRLTADWLKNNCSASANRPPLFVDVNCEGVPCFPPPGARLLCEDSFDFSSGCALGSASYVVDALDQLRFASLGGRFEGVECELLENPGPRFRRFRCQAESVCTVDLLVGQRTPELDITFRTLVEGGVRYPRTLVPPFGGYLSGLVPAAQEGVWVVSHEGAFTDRACDTQPENSRLLRLQQVGDRIEVVEDRPTESCLRLLRPTPGGGFFGAYRGGDGAWRWGRFDRNGERVAAVRLSESATVTYTPTAAGLADGTWVLGMTDLRSTMQREEQEGPDTPQRKSQFLAVAGDGTRISAGPVEIPRQAGSPPVFSIQSDASGAAVVGLDDSDIRRVNPQTLLELLEFLSFRVTTRAGVNRTPHRSLPIPGRPDEMLFISISETRYGGPSSRFRNNGFVHWVRDFQGQGSRQFPVFPADPVSAVPWPTPDSDRRFLVGMVRLDPEAVLEQRPPNRALGGLAWLDLDRPGFDPEWVDVGPGPVTGLSWGSDGAVWGVMAWTGAVFRVEASAP